jgi:predicted Fe-Mo cluster-binding NifX family protein
MRIAVASEGLDVSSHFSSCTNFNFYKVENNELVDSRNLPSQEHLCGSQANFLRQIEVRILICGTISQRDIEIMNKAGITVVTGASGNALHAADDYLHQRLANITISVA